MLAVTLSPFEMANEKTLEARFAVELKLVGAESWRVSSLGLGCVCADLPSLALQIAAATAAVEAQPERSPLGRIPQAKTQEVPWPNRGATPAFLCLGAVVPIVIFPPVG